MGMSGDVNKQIYIYAIDPLQSKICCVEEEGSVIIDVNYTSN